LNPTDDNLLYFLQALHNGKKNKRKLSPRKKDKNVNLILDHLKKVKMMTRKLL